MDWDSKIKLVNLGNQNETSDEARKMFQDYSLEIMEHFDNQGWDMYFDLVTIDIEQMKSDIDYWKQVYPFLQKINYGESHFGARTALRAEMIQLICKDNLNIE